MDILHIIRYVNRHNEGFRTKFYSKCITKLNKLRSDSGDIIKKISESKYILEYITNNKIKKVISENAKLKEKIEEQSHQIKEVKKGNKIIIE